MNTKNVAIVGLGLIGGSIGLALKAKTGLFVAGFDADAEVRKRALDIHAIDFTSEELKEVVSQAHIVFICTPIAQTILTLNSVIPFLSSGTIVTDVASVKSEIIFQMKKRFSESEAVFIGGHPMAGKETQGIDTADPDLFEKHVWVLIVEKAAETPELRILGEVIRAMGAKTILLDQETHDRAMASISHLPLIIASMLLETASNSDLWKISGELAAGGFKDTTRLASGNPQLHADIICSNRENILLELSKFEIHIKNLREKIEQGDYEQIKNVLSKNKEIRDIWQNRNS